MVDVVDGCVSGLIFCGCRRRSVKVLGGRHDRRAWILMRSTAARCCFTDARSAWTSVLPT